MDQDLKKQIEEQSAKLNEILLVIKKLKKYFLITMWVTVIMIVLPIIGLIIVIPIFMSTYVETLGGGIL